MPITSVTLSEGTVWENAHRAAVRYAFGKLQPGLADVP